MKTIAGSVQPFTINIPQEQLDDLQTRLSNIRWAGAIPESGWEYGTDIAYMKELVHYWQHQFNWRDAETRLNHFSQFTTEIDGLKIHFLHIKGKGPSATPLLLLHGYPDSFFRMLKLIPLLTAPGEERDDHSFSFDLVIPSLPGMGFSEKSLEKGFNVKDVATIMDKLMTVVLEYDQYAVHGGDWGSSITERLAADHKGNLIGIHLTDIPYWRIFTVQPDKLSKAEQDYLQRGREFQMTQGGYAILQATRPQNLSIGLNDSPVGLAAWIIDMFRGWSDCNGNIETKFTKDELLTNIMIYWVTQTFESAVRYYFEANKMDHKDYPGNIEVPTAIAAFPKDLVPAPREFGERFYNIQSWTEMPSGGHFAAMEEPELLAADIRKFFGKLMEQG